MGFKRSQVEDAICRASMLRGQARSKALVRIKRLLDIDRRLRPRPKAARYAFFSEAGPGKGQEILFSPYEAFALDIALFIVMQGMPQLDIVEIFRFLRADLEIEHKGILAKPLRYYMSPPTDEEPEQTDSSEHPIFLAITPAALTTSPEATHPLPFVTKGGLTAQILRGGSEWWNQFWETRGKALTTLELTLLAHALHAQLQVVRPRQKGRG
jgi:hypothetical protein